jgi:preprotein translocase subunit SecG
MVLSIAQVVSSIVLIAVILIQSGKTAGLSGAIGGGSDTFLSKHKDKTFDARLTRATKWIAIAFVGLTLILNIL